LIALFQQALLTEGWDEGWKSTARGYCERASQGRQVWNVDDDKHIGM